MNIEWKPILITGLTMLVVLALWNLTLAKPTEKAYDKLWGNGDETTGE